MYSTSWSESLLLLLKGPCVICSAQLGAKLSLSVNTWLTSLDRPYILDRLFIFCLVIAVTNSCHHFNSIRNQEHLFSCQKKKVLHYLIIWDFPNVWKSPQPMLSREKLSLISLIYSALFNSYWCSCYVLSTGPFTLEPVWDFTWATLTFTVFSFYMLLFLQPLGMVSDIASYSINILKENKPSFIPLNNEWILNKYSASVSFWFGQGKQKLVWNIG